MAGRLGLKSRSGSNEILGISSGYIPICPAPRIARTNSQQQGPSQLPRYRSPTKFGGSLLKDQSSLRIIDPEVRLCEKIIDWHAMTIWSKIMLSPALSLLQELSYITSHCSVTPRALSIFPLMAQNPCKAIAASRPKSSPPQPLSAALRAVLRSKHRSKYGIARCVKPKIWYACPTLNSASCFSDKLPDRCRLS